MTRTPPPILKAERLTVNPEAERAFLACLMRDPDMRLIVENQITADHFATTNAREAFEAISGFIADGTPPDPATLKGAVSGATLIELETSLSENASAANSHVYAKLLKQAKRERDEQAARDSLSKALDGGAPPHELAELFAAVRAAGSGFADKASPPPFKPTNLESIAAARLSPKCIVENMLFADLALTNAEGGVGKTTTMLYEAIHIALGMDLWGCRVLNPGKTLFVTAEDSEELLHARLHELMNALNLSDRQRRTVAENFMVWDVSGSLVRLAETDFGGNLRLTALADQIVETYRDAGLVQVIFDPAISFGPGESTMNDGHQAVVTACRRIVRGLNCCVRMIHHTGQSNARNGAIDQYSGRGGTAFPDGARMVTILANATRVNLQKPDGFELQPGESGFVMSRSKLSYCPPQPKIWVRRSGWKFDYFLETPRDGDAVRKMDAEKVVEFLADELPHGRRYTARSLEDTGKTKMPRARLRAALATLETAGQVEERDLPQDQRRGKRKTYLHPIGHKCADSPGAMDAKNACQAGREPPIAPPAAIAPPYREKENGAIDAVSLSPCFSNAPKIDGAIAAQWRNSEDKEGLAVELARLAGLDVGRMLAGRLVTDSEWSGFAGGLAKLNERHPDKAEEIAALVDRVNIAAEALEGAP